MREGWEVKTLGEVGKVSMCKRILKKQTNTLTGIPFYKIGTFGKNPNAFISEEIYNEFKRKYSFPKKGDILLSASGTIGRRVIYDGKPAYFQDSNIVWIDNDETEVLNEYLYEFYGFCDWNPSKGATISRLYNDDLRRIEIPIPPLQEQKQIVTLLDQAFTAIDQAKANIQKNIENAKELFQSKLNDVFSQKGEGWEEKSLGEVAKYDKTRYVETDRPYVGLENIESNSGKYLGDLEPNSVKSSTFQFDQRHVLYGRLRPYLNKVLVPFFKGHCSTEIFPILPTKEVNREYLFYWFLSPETVVKIDATWTGARMPRANMNEVINFKLPIPSLDIQKEVSENLSNLNKSLEMVIIQNNKQLLNIEDLKKSILQKAFSGELTQIDVTV